MKGETEVGIVSMEAGRKDVEKERDGMIEVVRTFQLPLIVFIIIVKCMVSTVVHSGLTLLNMISC